MRNLCTLLCSIFLFIQSYSQATSIVWQKGFGGSNYDQARSMIATADGGFLLSAESESNNNSITGNHGSIDIVIIKTDSIGNLVWQKSFGGNSYEECGDIKQTPDGGYIVLGFTNSTNGDVIGSHGGGDIWLFKTNAAGTLLWQKCYGGTNWETGQAIRLTADGGFVIVGTTSSTNGDMAGNHGTNDVCVLKLSATGSIQWQKCYGGTSSEYGYDITTTTDGGYIFAGSAESVNGDVSGNHGGRDFWVVKTSATGVLQWQKCYGSTASYEKAENIMATPDGGYMVSGHDEAANNGDFYNNHGDVDARLVKISNTGTIEWTKGYGGSGEEEVHTLLTSEGGYLIYGLTSSNNTGDVSSIQGDSDGWLAKLNSAGVLQWQQCFGNIGDEYIGGIVETSDKGYAFVADRDTTGGIITPAFYGRSDLWLVKLSQDFMLGIRAICPQGSINFASGTTGTTYQWQQSTDSVTYTNLSDNATITGTTTATLHLVNIPSVWYGYRYRCLVNGNAGIIYTIAFTNRWVGVSSNTAWENPANWSCGVLPDANTDVTITSGNVILNSNATVRSLRVSPGATFTVRPGYQLVITH